MPDALDTALLNFTTSSSSIIGDRLSTMSLNRTLFLLQHCSASCSFRVIRTGNRSLRRNPRHPALVTDNLSTQSSLQILWNRSIDRALQQRFRAFWKTACPGGFVSRHGIFLVSILSIGRFSWWFQSCHIRESPMMWITSRFSVERTCSSLSTNDPLLGWA